MKFHRPDAVLHVPDGTAPEAALARTTHLGIGAHQDDLEIMAVDGILRCYGRDDAWFTGVVVSDGAGSPRAGRFANFTNVQMVTARIEEQKRAADIGERIAVLADGPCADPRRHHQRVREIRPRGAHARERASGSGREIGVRFGLRDREPRQPGCDVVLHEPVG